MKAIVVTEEAAGTAGMKLVERPEPQPAINDVIVEVHASGFVGTELGWPSTWTDRNNRDRTPSIPGHELAGIVTALGYGTTGLSVGQRVFGLADWHRDGTLAEYVAMEARNLAPLPGDVDFTVGASLPISGLTAWQGLFQHGQLQAGQRLIAHGAAGAVGSMVTQLATGEAACVDKAVEHRREDVRRQLRHLFASLDHGDVRHITPPTLQRLTLVALVKHLGEPAFGQEGVDKRGKFPGRCLPDEHRPRLPGGLPAPLQAVMSEAAERLAVPSDHQIQRRLVDGRFGCAGPRQKEALGAFAFTIPAIFAR